VVDEAPKAACRRGLVRLLTDLTLSGVAGTLFARAAPGGLEQLLPSLERVALPAARLLDRDRTHLEQNHTDRSDVTSGEGKSVAIWSMRGIAADQSLPTHVAVEGNSGAKLRRTELLRDHSASQLRCRAVRLSRFGWRRLPTYHCGPC
jgi:hypothetical protein